MEPRSFRMPRSQVVATRLLTVAFAGAGLVAAALLPFLSHLGPGDRLACALIVAGCVAGVAWGVRRARRLAGFEVVLEAGGLVARSDADPEQRLTWNEVHAIRDRVLRDRMEVVSVGDAVHIELPYTLDDFGTLIRAVVEHTPQAQPALPLPAVLEGGPDMRVRAALGLTGAVGGLAAVLALWEGNLWMAVAGVGLVAGLGALLAVTGIRRLEVDTREIRVVKAFGSRALPLAEIAAVHLRLRETGKNQRVLEVVLERRDGRAEWVRPLGADLVQVYRTLASAIPAG